MFRHERLFNQRQICHCNDIRFFDQKKFEKYFTTRKQKVLCFSKLIYVMLGCQLPDFSLRSQTFCYTADFSTTFYICLKPRLFWTSHHKTTSKHHRIQEFGLYFAKFFCDFRQKRRKRSHPSGSFCAWAGLWPTGTRMLSTLQSFQTFLKSNNGALLCLKSLEAST